MTFTGERFIPGEGGCQIAYEHLHRYFFALRWAENNEVLDLACGNGYGAALLARRAHHVWALDSDEETIREAHKNWQRENLAFLRGDATQLPFRNGTISVIVAMEALEHIKEQDLLLREISRVCGADGTLLISTPNKAEYSDARKYSNPFHVRELYLDEFADLLRQHFSRVEIAGQQVRAGSLIKHNPLENSCEIFEEPTLGMENALPEPMYYLAICSQRELKKQIPSGSAYLDSTDGFILEGKQEMARLGSWGKSLECVVEERDRTIHDLQKKMTGEVELRDQCIRDLQIQLAREVNLRDRAIQDLQNQMTQEVDSRDRAIQDLQSQMTQEVDSRDRAIQNLQQEMRTEIDGRDRRIDEILDLLHRKEKEFDDRGKWALSLQAEVEHLVHIRQTILYRILSRLGLLPK